jgi:hypothetical protein
VQVEISGRLLRLIRTLAEAQGRGEDEILEEAVMRYLRELGIRGLDIEDKPGVDRGLGDIYVGRTGERSHAPFLSLITRMSSRFDLGEDEAMRIAVEEQQAFRRERNQGTDDS